MDNGKVGGEMIRKERIGEWKGRGGGGRGECRRDMLRRRRNDMSASKWQEKW